MFNIMKLNIVSLFIFVAISLPTASNANSLVSGTFREYFNRYVTNAINDRLLLIPLEEGAAEQFSLGLLGILAGTAVIPSASIQEATNPNFSLPDEMWISGLSLVPDKLKSLDETFSLGIDDFAQEGWFDDPTKTLLYYVQGFENVARAGYETGKIKGAVENYSFCYRLLALSAKWTVQQGINFDSTEHLPNAMMSIAFLLENVSSRFSINHTSDLFEGLSSDNFNSSLLNNLLASNHKYFTAFDIRETFNIFDDITAALYKRIPEFFTPEVKMFFVSKMVTTKQRLGLIDDVTANRYLKDPDFYLKAAGIKASIRGIDKTPREFKAGY